MTNTQGELCPRCKKNRLDPNEVMNALSRKDNDTYICKQCGAEEALEEYNKFMSSN